MISMFIYRGESFITMQKEGLRSPLCERFSYLTVNTNQRSIKRCSKHKLHHCTKNRPVISGRITITLAPLSKRGRLLGSIVNVTLSKLIPLQFLLILCSFHCFCRPAFMSSHDLIGPYLIVPCMTHFQGKSPTF